MDKLTKAQNDSLIFVSNLIKKAENPAKFLSAFKRIEKIANAQIRNIENIDGRKSPPFAGERR